MKSHAEINQTTEQGHGMGWSEDGLSLRGNGMGGFRADGIQSLIEYHQIID